MDQIILMYSVTPCQNNNNIIIIILIKEEIHQDKDKMIIKS